MKKLLLIFITLLCFTPSIYSASSSQTLKKPRIYSIGNSGSSKTINWTKGSVQHITLTDNCSITFTGGQSGENYILIVKQGTGGNKTITWSNTIRWVDDTEVSLSTTEGKTDYIGFVFNNIDSKYDCIGDKTGF